MNNQIFSYNGIIPKVDESVYLAPGAYIIGDVHIDKLSSVWINAVLRGDVAAIKIGSHTNIQDGTVVHCSRFDGSTHIGNHVTIGHQATIHACTLQDYSFIGMQSIIMDKVIVKSFGFVAAGSLVPPGKIVESYELWSGRPARKMRDLRPEEIDMIKDSSLHYVELSKKYKS